MEAEIRSILPFQSDFTVTMANDPVLDAWRGAAAFAASSDFASKSISRADYNENGADVLVEHAVSNAIEIPLHDAPQLMELVK